MIAWLTQWFSKPSESQQVESFDAEYEPSQIRNQREGKIDPYSDTWIFIEDWAKAELAKAREENDSSKRDDVQTALLRGRIKLLKEVIELPLPPKRERQRTLRQLDEVDEAAGY